jgi:hypothetical protein
MSETSIVARKVRSITEYDPSAGESIVGLLGLRVDLLVGWSVCALGVSAA